MVREAKRSIHVRLTKIQFEILDNLIENTVGIDSYNAAIEHAILCLEAPEDVQSLRKKVSAMSKNIDILMEMTAGGFHDNQVREILSKEDCKIYHDAKEKVEGNIQRATTKRSSRYKIEL